MLTPTFEGTTLDVPSLPAAIQSVFTSACDHVIFDVGGDPSGAAALGRYAASLSAAGAEILCVVNTCRPFTSDAPAIAEMAGLLRASCRQDIAGLVCNTNLARATTSDVLEEGCAVVEEASAALGIPIALVTGMREVLDGLSPAFRQKYQGRLFELKIYMRPDWLDQA